MEDLKVTVKGDISDLVDAFKKANGDADKFANNLKNKFAPALNKLTASSNTAGQSLQNLGRIAQDAPFGFIGIQNNINPLIESFQRLKVETGSTKGALKSLVSSLGGAGGIGLAVSVATGLLTVLAQNGFFTAAKAADEAGEAMKKFKENVEGAFKEAAKEATGVTALVAVLKSETETRVRKNDALKELQKINPEIFGQLKLEEGAVIGLDAAYQNYIANFKTVIAAKILQIQLEDKITKLLKVQGIEQSSLTKNLMKGFKEQFKDAPLVMSKLQMETNKAAKETGVLDREIADLTQRLTELSTGVDVPHIKEKVAAVKKEVETISDVLAKLKRQIEVIGIEEDIFHLDKSKDKISAINSAIGQLVDRFKQTAQSPVVIDLIFQAKEIQERGELRKLMPKLIPKDLKIPVPLTVTGPDLAAVDAAMEKLGKRVIPQINDIAETIRETMNSALSGLGEAIGNSLATGGDLGKAIFGNLFQVLADGLKQIGESLIALGTAKIAIEKFKFAPGLGTVLAGVATVALAALLKASMPKFATGGFVSGPGTSKSDSIHARLSKGEYIMSAETVSRFGKGFFDMINGGGRPRNGGFASGGSVSGGNIGGGFTQTIIPDVVVRGSDLLLVFDRASSRRGRNG